MAENNPLQNAAFRAPGLLERMLGLFLGKSRPLDCIQVEVTSFCNGHCIYCPHTIQARQWQSRHMSAEIFAALWPLLRRSGRAHLQGWGEPFLHPLFFDFVALARKADCQVSATSCGLQVDSSFARRIVQSGMDILAFSLAGTDHASNMPRAGVPFEQVCAAIRSVQQAIETEQGKQESSLRIHLAYLLLADRMEAVTALPQLMEKLNVGMAVISTLDHRLVQPAQASLAFSVQEKEKLEHARAILEKTAARAAAAGRNIYYTLPGDTAQSREGACHENVSKSLFVSSDGSMSPCVHLKLPTAGGDTARHICFGNVLEDDPWQVWNSREYRQFRKQLQEGVLPAYCLACPNSFPAATE
jgi:MoaA/NifB/PqqE/SkfB family radical SAM enzyme